MLLLVLQLHYNCSASTQRNLGIWVSFREGCAAEAEEKEKALPFLVRTCQVGFVKGLKETDLVKNSSLHHDMPLCVFNT